LRQQISSRVAQVKAAQTANLDEIMIEPVKLSKQTIKREREKETNKKVVNQAIQIMCERERERLKSNLVMLV